MMKINKINYNMTICRLKTIFSTAYTYCEIIMIIISHNNLLRGCRLLRVHFCCDWLMIMRWYLIVFDVGWSIHFSPFERLSDQMESLRDLDVICLLDFLKILKIHNNIFHISRVIIILVYSIQFNYYMINLY